MNHLPTLTHRPGRAAVATLWRDRSAFTRWRQGLRRWHLVLLGIVLLLSSLIITLRVISNAQAEVMAQLVYCSSTVEITFPDRRIVTRIGHPPEGGIEAIQTSLARLDHRDLPPKPWPDGWEFSYHGSECADSWASMYDGMNFITLGRVGFLLDQNAPFDEANIRQAILKALYGDQFEIADELFPPARLPTLSEE